MKRTFIQFACDIDTIDAMKFIASEKHITLTALCRELVFDYLSRYVQEHGEEMVNENQTFQSQEREVS